MEPFGSGLNFFIEQVKQIDYDPEKDGEKLYAVMDIGAALSMLEKNLEAQGGWADAIAGIKSLSGFGGELPDFASGLNSFIEQTSTLDNEKYDETKIQNALNVANAINELRVLWARRILGFFPKTSRRLEKRCLLSAPMYPEPQSTKRKTL